MTQLRVQLGYFHPWTNDAGVYMARATGVTEAHGIDLLVSVGDPGRGDTIAHLNRSEVDLGLVPLNRLIAARARGERLVGVAAINQTGLEAIHSLRSRGVSRPRDLAGKRLALNPTPRGLAMVRHLVAADGGNPDELIIVDSGTRELQSRHLLDDKADAYFGSYWVWDELFDSYDPQDRIAFPVKDFGAPLFHSYVLAAREELVEQDPDLIGRALTSFDHGYRYAASHTRETLEHLDRVFPYFPEEIIARSLDLVATTWFHEGAWGTLRDSHIDPYAQWLLKNKAVPSLDRFEGAFTREFLPQPALDSF